MKYIVYIIGEASGTKTPSLAARVYALEKENEITRAEAQDNLSKNVVKQWGDSGDHKLIPISKETAICKAGEYFLADKKDEENFINFSSY